jgi:hypothetical protein
MGCSQPPLEETGNFESPAGQDAFFPGESTQGEEAQEESAPETDSQEDYSDDPVKAGAGETGQVVLTIGLAGDGLLDMPELPEGGILLSRTGTLPGELVIQLPETLTCLIHGKKAVPINGEIIIRAADYGLRKYFITLMGIQDGVPYGREIPFTVVE